MLGMTTYGGQANCVAPDATATADSEWNTSGVRFRTPYYKGNYARAGVKLRGSPALWERDNKRPRHGRMVTWSSP
jgi:hypothetical protein